jgi:hypothetical protein
METLESKQLINPLINECESRIFMVNQSYILKHFCIMKLDGSTEIRGILRQRLSSESLQLAKENLRLSVENTKTLEID